MRRVKTVLMTATVVAVAGLAGAATLADRSAGSAPAGSPYVLEPTAKAAQKADAPAKADELVIAEDDLTRGRRGRPPKPSGS